MIKISLLVVVIKKINNYSIEFTVHRKSIYNDVYLYWESFALLVVVIKKINNYSIEFTVHRKSIYNDVYLHWESFAPEV